MSLHLEYINFFPTEGTKNIATRNVYWPHNIPKRVCGQESAPRTPLGELTALPDPAAGLGDGSGRKSRRD